MGEAEFVAVLVRQEVDFGGGDAVGTGQAKTVLGQGEVGRNEAVGAFFVSGDESDQLGLALADGGHLGPGFAAAVDLVAGDFTPSGALKSVGGKKP